MSDFFGATVRELKNQAMYQARHQWRKQFKMHMRAVKRKISDPMIERADFSDKLARQIANMRHISPHDFQVAMKARRQKQLQQQHKLGK